MLDLSSYIPDSITPQYNWLRDITVQWLRALGIIRGISTHVDGRCASPTLVISLSDVISTIQSLANHVRPIMMQSQSIILPKKRSSMMKKSLQNSLISKDSGVKVNGRNCKDYVYLKTLESRYFLHLWPGLPCQRIIGVQVYLRGVPIWSSHTKVWGAS